MKIIDRTFKPYDYQEEILQYIITNNLERFGLFWEMRLGKSIVTLEYLQRKNATKILVVCPLAVVPVWQNYAYRYKIRPVIFHAKNKTNSYPPTTVDKYIVITNYEFLLTKHNKLEDNDWSAVILDESQNIINPKTKTSRYVCSNFRSVPIRICLTGTPTARSPIDYFQQMKFIQDSFLGCKNWYEFKHKYFFNDDKNIPQISYGARRTIEDGLTKSSFALKRQHVHVGMKKHYKSLYCTMPDEYAKNYAKLERDWILGEIEIKFAIVAQNYLHQLTGGYPKFETPFQSNFKIKELESTLATIGDSPVVIWCSYITECKAITQRIPDSYIITSETDQNTRQSLLYRFNKGEIKNLVCTYGTLNVGVDLSPACDTQIFFSNSWGKNARCQAEDRIINTAKDRICLFIDLITQNSIDEDIYRTLKDRRTNEENFTEILREKFLQRLQANTEVCYS